MADKTPKVGDPVLFYGRNLEIVEITTDKDNPLARVADPADLKKRSDAHTEIKRLRVEQAELAKKDPKDNDGHEELAGKIEEQTEIAREAMFIIGLRVVLLNWWEERGVWTSEGRILSSAQRKKFESIMGVRKTKPSSERAALALLEAQGG